MCDCCHWQCRHLYLWLSAVAFVICAFLVIGMGSPVWVEGKYGDKEHVLAGLLLFCHQRDPNPDWKCAPLLMNSQHGWHDAVRVLSVLAWVFLFTVFVLGIILHKYDDHCVYSCPLTTFAIFSALLGVTAGIIYGVAWMKPERLFPQFHATLSWGFAIYILAHMAAIILFVVIALMSRHRWQNQLIVGRALKHKPRGKQGGRREMSSSMAYSY